MAWTDYSSTPANNWDSAIGTVAYDTNVSIITEDLGGGSGGDGSTRPASGMLYPRGQG